MAAQYTPPPRSRIDELMASRKQAIERQRQLEHVSTRILTTKSAEIMDSHQDDVMEHVAQLLQTAPNLQLQKVFLLRGLKHQGAKALRVALQSKNHSLVVLKIMQHNSDEAEIALQTVFDQGISLSRLHELVLHDCAMYEVETMTALVQALRSPTGTATLQRLSLVDIPSLGSHDPSLLGQLLQAPHLQHVKFIRCNIQPNGAAAMANALMDDNNNNIRSRLEYLNLQGNPIGNEGTTSLAKALRHNTTLRHLLLCQHCDIGNAGAFALADMLPHNTTLHELDVSGNPDILIRGKEALVEGLKYNISLVSTGLRVTRRHPLRPTVVEQMGRLLSINATRQLWNTHHNTQKATGPSLLLPPARRGSSTTTTSDDKDQSHVTSSLLPHYLAKVGAKLPVLHLSLQENADLFLPYL